jgi:hypothetical protein
MITRDAVIEGRLDSRDLANCASFLTSKGIVLHSNSELIYFITQIAVHAIGSGVERSTQEAREYLASIGLDNMNRSGRGKRILQSVLQKENLMSDGFDPMYGSKRLTKGDLPDDEELKKIADNILKCDL